ncbi:MAG TPA: hypothetical protein VFL63_12305 [Rhodanobacteraceae bacterium]|nr:hypothetical protein [Rhodanobacteraceae bacterium]
MRSLQSTGINQVTWQAHGRACLHAGIIGILIASLAFPATLNAAGARNGVHAKPGEIVLLRNVPTRPAVRTAPPGLALLVDPTPNAQIKGALGSAEMSDAEAGAINAPVRAATGDLTATLTGRASITTTGTTGGLATPRQPDNHTGPLGAVGSATRAIGPQVTGALQALPLGKPAGG